MKQAALAASARPGYQRRWINDTPGRLQQAEAGGYSYVSEDPNAKSTDVGSRTSRVVGKDESGQGMRAYLMEIPRTGTWKTKLRSKSRSMSSSVP